MLTEPETPKGMVYLVGAGPGDPGLLTVRALELLRAADVVAYDKLVSQAILSLVRPEAELLPVGRRHGVGKTGYRLHPEVLARAKAGHTVVRLKAGDPLIFGRGGEEAEELAEAGIPCTIVPGVSAALGAAAYAGIPLTHRLHASEVTFMSGHDVDGNRHSFTDWSKAATGNGTLVLFMAARKLSASLQRLIQAGRSAETPAAYIASATTPDQNVIVATLATLADKTRDVDLTIPALVIVGDVVGLRERIAWFERRPLQAGGCLSPARGQAAPRLQRNSARSEPRCWKSPRSRRSPSRKDLPSMRPLRVSTNSMGSSLGAPPVSTRWYHSLSPSMCQSSRWE